MAILPASLLLAFYLYLDQSLYRNDEGFNLEVVQQIYLKLTKEGFQSFFTQLYWTRSMRPTLLTPLTALLLWVTAGHTELATKFFSVLGFMALMIFVTQIFAKAKSRWERISIPVVLSLIPWVFRTEVFFSSEILGLIGMAGVVYYYLKLETDEETKKKLWTMMGISSCAALVALSRPVEGVLIFYPLLLIFIFLRKNDLKQKFWNLIPLLQISIPLLLFSVLQIQNGTHAPNTNLPLYFGLFFISLSGALWFFFEQTRATLALWAPFHWLCFAWYGPFSNDTYEWAFVSSLGKMAKISGNRGDQTYWGFVGEAFFHFIGLPLGVLLLLSLIVLIISKWNREKNTWTRLDGAFLGALIVPLAFGGFSYNSDLRYYIFSFFGLLLLVLYRFSLGPSSAQIKWTFRTVIIFVSCIFLVSEGQTFGLPSVPNWLVSHRFELWPRSVQRASDDLIPVVGKLMDSIQESSLPKESNICILQMRTNDGLEWLLDPWAMTVYMRELGSSLHFIRPYPHAYDNMQDRFEHLVKPQCCYVVVFPTVFKPGPIEHFMSDVGEYFLQNRNTGELAKNGFEEASQFEVKIPGSSGELVLFKSNNLSCKVTSQR